jgi:hypothetical protein
VRTRRLPIRLRAEESRSLDLDTHARTHMK